MHVLGHLLRRLCCKAMLTEGMCALLQIPCLVRMSRAALEEGKCVVIGLQSTGEARTADVVAEKGDILEDYVSGPRVLPSPPTPPLLPAPQRCSMLPTVPSSPSHFARCQAAFPVCYCSSQGLAVATTT